MSSTTPAPSSARTTRRPLNRRRVLQAALGYVDSHGLAELTMRRLATELGVEAASLYKHVASKEDLHAGVAELIWEQIANAAPPDDDWPSWLRAYGHAIRDVIHRHPGALALWAAQPIAPVPALELFDAQLQHCQPGTATSREATDALRAVSAFAIGYTTTELWFAPPATEQPESETQRIGRIARALPSDAPDRLIDIALAVCTGYDTDAFETGLNLMINGLAGVSTWSPAKRVEPARPGRR